MRTKANAEAGADVSKNAPADTATAATEHNQAIARQEAAEVTTGDEEISGKLAAVITPEMRAQMALELREALGQIEAGFGELTAPGTIFGMAQPFYIINALTLDDYLEREGPYAGELKTKHIFQLEFEGGIVRNMMQSDARPRRVLARAFVLARGLGGQLKSGPYMLEKKPIKGQISPAYILAQQSGCRTWAVK